MAADGARSWEQLREEVHALVRAERARSLWHLREDFLPGDAEAAVRVLREIERHADRETYKTARKLRRWLSPTPSASSAG